jgi:phosphoribosylformylglycinamidine synthase PurS subunit
MKAVVHVSLKAGVLDVQGKAVEAALHGLGWGDVKDVRVGRTVTFELPDGDKGVAEKAVTEMCERLLANTVIEAYQVEVAP